MSNTYMRFVSLCNDSPRSSQCPRSASSNASCRKRPSLTRAKGAPAAASQQKTAVTPKVQCDNEEKTEQDKECTFLSMVQRVSEYMIKVDECQLELPTHSIWLR